MGNYIYDENMDSLYFDTYIYDFGFDGLPGDPFIDTSGDGELQIGECLSFWGGFSNVCDVGLDGLPNTGDDGEQDGQWQPGDGWIDENQNGIPDFNTTRHDNYISPDGSQDPWPPPNRYWDERDQCLGDYGQDGIDNTGDPGEHDGICIGKDGYQGEDWNDINGDGNVDVDEYTDLNGNGKYDGPTGEWDGVFDTGDNLYAFEGEPFNDYGAY